MPVLYLLNDLHVIIYSEEEEGLRQSADTKRSYFTLWQQCNEIFLFNIYLPECALFFSGYYFFSFRSAARGMHLHRKMIHYPTKRMQ